MKMKTILHFISDIQTIPFLFTASSQWVGCFYQPAADSAGSKKCHFPGILLKPSPDAGFHFRRHRFLCIYSSEGPKPIRLRCNTPLIDKSLLKGWVFWVLFYGSLLLFLALVDHCFFT
jgi:hypothetical protein